MTYQPGRKTWRRQRGRITDAEGLPAPNQRKANSQRLPGRAVNVIARHLISPSVLRRRSYHTEVLEENETSMEDHPFPWEGRGRGPGQARSIFRRSLASRCSSSRRSCSTRHGSPRAACSSRAASA